MAAYSKCSCAAAAVLVSERDQLLDDIGVLLSRLLQHGDQLADLGRGLGRQPDGGPASVVGPVVDLLKAEIAR